MNRLLNHTNSPPGQFFIKVRFSGGAITLIYGPCSEKDGCYTFGPSPEINDVARRYGEFLSGNNLPGGDFATSLQAVDEYTCTRLGGGKSWCRSSDKPYATKSIAARAKGGCCGAKL